MAARSNTEQIQKTRDRIQTTQIVERLVKHTLNHEVLGKDSKGNDIIVGVDIMTTSQVNAAKVLLNKTLPDIKQIELSGEDGSALTFNATIGFK